MNENMGFLSLSTPLPEDIAKLKWSGHLDQAARVIDLRLETDLPQAMRQRLIIEREILKRLPGQYPYTWEDARRILAEEIRDFKDEELTQLWEGDAADWIYIDGRVHFRSSFLANILKTRPAYGARVVRGERLEGKRKNFQLLEETIERMKEKGGLGYRFRIRSTMKIAPRAEREGEEIKVYLPLPIEYAQVRNVKIYGVYIGGRKAEESEYTLAPAHAAQRTVCIRAVHHCGQEYAVEFSFENHAPYVDLSLGEGLEAAAGLVQAVDQAPAAAQIQPGVQGKTAPQASDELAEILAASGEQLPHIRFTPYLRALTEEVTAGVTNPLLRARKIYDYITSHVMYSYVRSYFTLTDIPEYVSTCFKGDCGVQALLFITMCRAAGIPARWQAGLYTTPLEIGCHDWAQFYVAPFGWLYADCSFGGAAYREGYEARWNFYFGNLEPFRLPTARQFQADFEPPMSHLRSDPYDNQMGEAEYGDRSLLDEEFSTDHKMVELCEAEPQDSRS